jgi:alanine racemase
MLYVDQLPGITGGKIVSLQSSKPLPIEHLLIDSRKLLVPAHSLFFAIRGERHDGHQFIAELYQKGVRQFVVETIPDGIELPEATLLVVPNSLRALQAVAAWHRRQFQIPVIGITGSNGKTIIKEWLATLLSKSYRVVKSPRSYNSQVGVPLSVWQMNASHTIGVFEAGISQPQEMEYLEKVIQPTIGIFTNIGTAHDEGFESRQQKIAEKARLFEHCEAVIYCEDHTDIHEYLTQHLPPEVQRWTWRKPNSSPLEGDFDSRATNSLPLTGEGLGMGLTSGVWGEAENLQHCLALMRYLGIPEAEIREQVRLLHPVSMRLELKQGIRGCYVIDDTYNNDLAGLQIALDFLSNQQQRSKKTVILSDVLESGEPEAQLYAKIAEMLRSKHIDRLIGIGEVISRNAGVFDIPTILFSSTEEFLGLPQPPPKERAYDSPSFGGGRGEALFSNELILVKGARKFRFERIVQHLQQKTHGTVLEINLDAIAHNLNYYRSRIKPQTKLMAMVKAFAYGSGSAEIASLLQFHRVDYLAVAYADEGVVLRENGITLPIMVMNPSAETFAQMIEYQLEPEIYSPRILREFLDFLEGNDESARIHLKIETGMHRLGFEQEHIPDLLQTLQQNPRVQVAAIFSHLASSDNLLQRDYTLQQIETFKIVSSQIIKALGYEPIRHIVNSAGISHFPEAQFDMVRLGIGLYGVGANEAEQEHLQTVGTLKTTISQIKPVKVGETVGYGRRGQLPKDGFIATIAIGYADGFDRRFSVGNGKVWINGQLAPVVGSVCMDMTMVDVTDMEAQEGDEVIIFGEPLPIQQLAQWAGTIPYELMTGISERVKRVFFAE